ncbi:hypothetical protein [Meiothermus granaticius]|uniref:DUF3558 domain-containing protein n=1 Tax=Meiothermus granaticius NBRC 107808 TaxID=1227551 RepID=A0A399F3Y5_9DEIN|nr:hypothetical protein [Meiothermus granaticius]RIH91447.1 hypothetical protein Mgrana_02674 [Meiothermus granaticius NBRC 107808]GEM88313.1 hypothetical protein MGR01S_29380 [Meiothermus granaticius NBRC 107808]
MKMAWVIAAAFLIASAWAQSPVTCGWLSPQQVQAVLGAGTPGHERSPQTGQGNGVRITYGGCDWEIPGSSGQMGKALILTWAHLDSTRGPSAKELMQQTIQAEQAQTNVKFALTPLSGFGDEAYTLLPFETPAPSGAVVVRKGNSVVLVALFNVVNPFPQAQMLVRSVLAHMPTQ